MSILIYVILLHLHIYTPLMPEVICKKTCSVQGIVRPPIRWSYPNSSSASLNKFWNEGWFKYDVGITNLFISSPTYTARYPFGTFVTFDDVWLLLNEARLIAAGKRKPISNVLKNNSQTLRRKKVSVFWCLSKWVICDGFEAN